MTTQIADQLEKIEKMIAALPRRTERESREWIWENEVLPHIRASGLPERFWKEASAWKPEQLETYDETSSLLSKGAGAIVALVGERGVGKTTIAAQIIISRAKNPNLRPILRRPPYRKLSDLLARFKPLYADFGARDTEQLIGRHDSLCVDHALFVIDELHDCEDQRIKNRFLTDTLDKRYANLVDTIVISNQTPEEFIETTSDSVLSRIKEHGRIIHCTWESWR